MRNTVSNTSNLEVIKERIKSNINQAELSSKQIIHSFNEIGYYLKKVRDSELFLQDGYHSIAEFAKEEFGISKSITSRYIAINDKFSIGGNSEEMQDDYKEYSVSKLMEMITMSEEQLKLVDSTMTRNQIREIKAVEKEEQLEGQMNIQDEEFKEVHPDIVIKDAAIEEVTIEKVAPAQQEESESTKVRQEDNVIDAEYKELVDDPVACDFNIREEIETIIRDEFIYKKTNSMGQLIDNVTDSITDWIEKIENVKPQDTTLKVIQEEQRKEQPELPVLKNNDERKGFVDNYATWPIWIDQELTGERYYKYDFKDGVAFVVRVSLRHEWSMGKHLETATYGREEYYLLGIKTGYSNKPTYEPDDSRTFSECKYNKSTLIEYLKEIQKK